MKILLVNHFPLEGSGSGTYTVNLAKYLIKSGHDVSIVFPENIIPKDFPGASLHPVYFKGDTDLLNDEQINVLPFNYPCFTTHPRSTMTFGDLSDSETEQYLAAFDTAITEEINVFAPDIVHVQHIWCLSYLVSEHDVPSIITTHGTDLMGYEKWPAFRRFADEAADKCNRIIAISKDNCQSTINIFPREKEKITILSNGYDNDAFYPEKLDRTKLLAKYDIPYDQEQIVLFAGKLTEFKGVDNLLNAAKIYENKQPGNIITVIAGDGEKNKDLKALRDKNMLNSVYFIGHRNQTELRELYSNSDVFVMPSRFEPFGLVALEAMACGLPVIASNTGGLTDFITQEVGTLVNAEDPDQLSDAIIKELSNISSAVGRKSEIAEYAFKNHSQTDFINKLEKIYLDTISG